VDVAGNLDWSETGGIVQATGSTFRNCNRAIQFMTYQNISAVTGLETDNRSFATKCTFITDGPLNDGSDPYTFVSLLGVRGVKFIANTFRSDLTASKRGSGIVSIDASYKVLGNCTGAIGIGQPCPPANLVKNRFINLEAGIVTYQGAAVSDIDVKDADFIGCGYGMKLQGAHFTQVTNSTFDIPRGTSQYPYQYTNFGIYTEVADGFYAEENTFSASGSHGSADGRHVGIASYSSLFAPSDIYRNTFNGLETQVQDGNKTRNLTLNQMLQVDCNTFNTSAETISSVHHAKGGLDNQGQCITGNDIAPQANIFNGSCDGVFSNDWQIFKNATAFGFAYNSYVGTPVNINYLGCVENDITNNSTPCTGNGTMIPGLACPSTLNTGFSDYLSLYTNFKLRITDNTNLIDGGDTQGVLAFLASTSNPGQIKNYLLARSPYLSDKVLFAAIAKNLPHGIIKQILLANSTLSETVWNTVVNMGYPNGIFNELLASQTGNSPRIELEKENRFLTLQKLSALNGLVRIKLDSNEIDSAIWYLDKDGSIEASCKLIPVAIRRDTSITRNHLNRIHAEGFDPDVMATDSSRANELQATCAYGNLILKILSRPGAFYSILPSERLVIEEFASNNEAISINALAILRWLDEQVVFDDALPYEFSRSQIASTQIATTDAPSATDMVVYPNPNNGHFTIQGVTTIPYQNGVVLITDVTGRIIRKIQVSSPGFSIEADLNSCERGVYLCVLKLDNIITNTCRIIIQ
jgi:hypothetical protein